MAGIEWVHGSDEGTGGSRSKRLKSAIACEECRSKKIRCDGARPVCAACYKKHGSSAPCSWSILPARAEFASVRDHISKLEQRIRELESRNTSQLLADDINHFSCEAGRPLQHEGAQHEAWEARTAFPNDTRVSNDQTKTSTHTDIRTASVESLTTLNGPPFGISATNHDAHREPRAKVWNHDETSAAKASAMMGDIDDETQSQGFFGDSSAAGFIKHLKNAVDSSIESPKNLEPSQSILDQVHLPLLMPENSTTQDPDIKFILPPRQVADSLLDIYFHFVHPLFPFVDKIELESYYQGLWERSTTHYGGRVCLSIINLIFALACQSNESIKPEQRAPSAEVFYIRAQEMIGSNIWGLGTIQSVQYFLLLGIYLQSTNDSAQCWSVIGMAIRTAQSLGIHLPTTTSAIKSSRRRELVCKVWNGCVMMDRVLSMIYGRPAMITEEDANQAALPLAVDEQYLSSYNDQILPNHSDAPSIIELFNQTLGLYKVLNSILQTFYSVQQVNYSAQNAQLALTKLKAHEWGSAVIRLDEALRKWREQLPSHLLVMKCSAYNVTFQKQATVLHSRYLHIRILLFRPMLHEVITNQPNYEQNEPRNDFSISEQLALRCAVMCVKAAQDTIEHVSSNLPRDLAAIGNLSAWWYNLLYVYTGATVLIAARMSPMILKEVPEEAVIQSWRNAIQILQRYASYSASAQRSIAVLRILFDKVPQHSLQQKAQKVAGQSGSGLDFQQSHGNTPSALQLFPFPNRADQGYGHLNNLWQFNVTGVAPGNVLHTPDMESDPMLPDLQGMDFAMDMSDLSWLNSRP